MDLALSLLNPDLSPAAPTTPSSEQLSYLLGPYDLKRLHSYASNLVDHHLVRRPLSAPSNVHPVRVHACAHPSEPCMGACGMRVHHR